MDYVIGNTRKRSWNKNYELNFEEIGKNIKKVRKDNNLTQKQLAEILNTTQSTISAYESGKTVLLTAFAIQISKKYNVSLDWLCGREK